VFHYVLQPLCYNIADMHKLTPNIHKVMAFPKWLSVKQNLRSGLIMPQLILGNRRLSLIVHTAQNLEYFEFNSRFRNLTTLRVS
jgi:hypothetical protein